MISVIDKSSHGKSIKEYLYTNLCFSASLVKKLKTAPDGILLNGEKVTVRKILSQGDILALACEDKAASDNIVPLDIPLDIIYEDEHLIALNKPAKMPTHPSHNHYDDTLANALVYYFSKKSRPFVFRAINRLDADTSGVVLVAKSMHCAHLLAKELSGGGFEKTYAALLNGRLSDDGVIDVPIMRKPGSTMLRCTDPLFTEKSKPCLTKYEVIKALDDKTLVYAHPITGRTHQLRVHFSSIGHPIYGDGLYGITNDGSDFPRLALHCMSLCLTHPFTKERIRLEAGLPPELSKDFDL